MDNPIIWLFAGILIVLCIVMVLKAGSSALNREKRMKLLYDKANRQKEILEKYKGKTPDEMRSCPADEVIEAIAVTVQRELADEPNANEAFLTLADYKKYAYAAYYFFYDSKENLSVFLRRNGEPLLSTAVELINKTDSEKQKELVNLEFNMLDDNNEEISVDNAKLHEWDEQFKECDQAELFEKVKHIILDLM